MIITTKSAIKIIDNAYIEIKENLTEDTADLDLFALGALIGSTLLRTLTTNYIGPAQDTSRNESQLADGLNAGLNLHAESLGVAYRDNPRKNCYGNLLN